MATKRPKKPTDRKTRVIVETPDQDEESLIPPEAVAKSQEEEDVEELLTSFPQESKVELWKWGDPEPDEWNYAGRYTVHGWSLDAVSREHGKGKYRMVVRGPKVGDDGRSRVVQLARRHFAVAGPRGLPDATGGLGGFSPMDMFKMNMELMRSMAMQPRENMADLVRAIHDLSPKPPTTDPMDTAIKLVTLLKQDKSDFEDLLEVLNTGIRLAEGRGEGDSIGTFARAFAGLMEKMPSDKKPDAVPPGGAPPALPSPEIINRQFFLMASQFFGRAAEKDADIDLYADWLVDQVEALPSLHPAIQTWFMDPTYPEPVIPLFPGVKPTWLRAVLLRARDMATGEDEPEGDEPEVEPDEPPEPSTLH